jgi:hypothetical protein
MLNTLTTSDRGGVERSDVMRIAQPKEPCGIVTAAMLMLMAEHKYRCYNLKIGGIHPSCRGNTTGDKNRHNLHKVGSFT